MFKNRSLQVRVVKTPKSSQTEATETVPKAVEYVLLAQNSAKEAVKGAALLMATYITADTLRKVTMHIVATKIN